MSSAGWFKRAKAGLALVEYMDRLTLFTPPEWLEELVAGELRDEGARLLEEYRQLTVTDPVKTLDTFAGRAATRAARRDAAAAVPGRPL